MVVKSKKHQTVKDRLFSILESSFKQHTLSRDNLLSIIRSRPKNISFLLVCTEPQLTAIKVILYKCKGNTISFQYGITKSKLEVNLDKYLVDWYLIPVSTTTLKLYDSINDLESNLVGTPYV